MIQKQHLFLYLFLILLLPFTGYSKITVLSETSGQVTLRITPDWSEEHIEKNENTYSNWSTSEINGTAIVKNHEIPVISFTLPLPPGVTPAISVANHNTFQRPSQPLSPTIQTDEPVKDQFVQFAGSSSFRGFTLGRFIIQPVKYDNGTVYLTSRATITITWSAPASSKSQIPVSDYDQELLKRTVLSSTNIKSSMNPEGLAKQQLPQSIDRAGTWYKIPITETGIYSVSYDWLQAYDVDLQNIDTRKIRVFTAPNFGLELDTPAGASMEKIGPALREIPITVLSSNNTFVSGNVIEFFGQAPSRYSLQNNSLMWHQHQYDTKNYYWLNLPDAASTQSGLRIDATSLSSVTPVITTAPTAYHYEEDLNNYLNSGRDWFGSILFGTHDIKTYRLPLTGLQPASPVHLVVRVARGNPKNRVSFNIALNEHDLPISASIPPGENANSTATMDATSTNNSLPFESGLNVLTLTSNGTTSSAQGLLDYIDIQYSRTLDLQDESGVMQFTTNQLTGVHTYALTGFGTDAQVYDITDPTQETQIGTSISGNQLRFTVDFGDIPTKKLFYVTEKDIRKRPQAITPVPEFEQVALRTVDNQTVDYIIITPEIFKDQAERLAAHRSTHYRFSSSGLNTRVAILSDIYNEFSGDIQDPVAIRNFLRWAYVNWRNPDSSERLKYVLLFGDGDYDYRNISGQSEIFVPTFQNTSTSPYDTKEVEDFFVLVDGNDNSPDLALGRLTATTDQEAKAMVDKIIYYDTALPFGQWRNTITLVGDDPYRPEDPDGYGNTSHIKVMESSVIPKIPQVFYLRKIYLPDYPIVQDLSSFGVTRPGVTTALLDQIQRGTLAINFSGHGSPKVWTQERVLTMERDLNRIEANGKLPLWIAATCEWGRFDMIADRCMAEGLLALPGNGAIATLSATRLSFLQQNLTYMGELFNQLFPDKNDIEKNFPVGAAVLAAKNAVSGDNQQRYALLGDPALQLAAPQYNATINDLNPDTLTALVPATFSGAVQLNSTPQNRTFSGTAFLSVYDTETQVHHSWERTSLTYPLPGPRIFYGPVSINQGVFNGKFMVPKDITYGGNSGKMTLIYQGTDSTVTGSGVKTPVSYRRTSSGVDDSEGPAITIGVKDYNFRSGDAVPASASMVIGIADSNGVNLTGNVGHQVMLILDGPSAASVDVTDRFSYDVDSYQKGELEYPLSNLSYGKYTVTVRAWDAANNLSIASSDLQVLEDKGFQVSEVVNYPNPARGSTDFLLTLSAPSRVEIRLYTLAGQPIRTLSATYAQPGVQQLHWDGRDTAGAQIANGVYLYKVTARALDSDDRDTYLGKLAVAR